MLRVEVVIDHKKFVHENTGVTREHLNSRDILDAMLFSIHGMGIDISIENVLDYFGVEIEEVYREQDEEDD